MAYDEHLAERVRAILGAYPDVRERRMFGGLGFMVQGSMAVAASSRGGLLARVDPAEGAALADDERVQPMVMRGRPMRGWLHVAPAAVGGEADLRRWVARSVAYVQTLPPT